MEKQTTFFLVGLGAVGLFGSAWFSHDGAGSDQAHSEHQPVPAAPAVDPQVTANAAWAEPVQQEAIAKMLEDLPPLEPPPIKGGETSGAGPGPMPTASLLDSLPDDLPDLEALNEQLQADRAARQEEPSFVDQPVGDEGEGGLLSKYYERWATERENPEGTAQAHDAALALLSTVQLDTHDVDVSCRETLCRIRVGVAGQDLKTLGEMTLPKQRLVVGNPAFVDGRAVFAIYHPIPESGVDFSTIMETP